jgi:diguanylate cyclase (GGDEF)-like protein/PAS domain S-box-containing protein
MKKQSSRVGSNLTGGNGEMTKEQLLEDVLKLRRKIKRLTASRDKIKTELLRKQMEAEALDAVGQAFIILDGDANIVFLNDALAEITGYGRKELMGRTPLFLCSETGVETQESALKAIREEGYWEGEIHCRKKSGDIYPIWISAGAVRDKKHGATHYAATAIDITTLKKTEKHLMHIAHHDVLTDLPNRTLMFDRMKQALALAKRHGYQVAVILLDLDRFKEINDTLGHHIGDQLLVEASERLVAIVRESDTVARLGGDEFLVILPQVGNANNAAHVAQKFLDTISEPFHLDGQELFISASIGIAMYPGDGSEGDAMLKSSDTAMYHAKAQGKNNYKFFTEEINKSTVERFMLESRFRRALEKLEFHLNYQPKIDVATGRITGIEALIRWYHPEQGSVKPGLFIPLAEETGFVVQLGEWVLREACRQNKEWQEEGFPPLNVAVNMSARQFHKKGLVEMIKEILVETGLEPKHLMIEITESAIVVDIEDTITTLNEMRQVGVGVSVDDFGTGYSSLNYLNRLPIDELKIDRSFIKDVVENEDSMKVVTAVIALAQSLNLKVVAEGIETRGQLELIRACRCDEAQGYLFSRPLSSEDLRKLILKGPSITL